MSNRTQTRTIPAIEATPAGHLPFAVQATADTRQPANHPADTTTTEGARGHGDQPTQQLDDENAAYLPTLTAECDKRGLALQITDADRAALPEFRVIDGQLTVTAWSGELGVALDEVRCYTPCHVYPGLCTSIDGDDGDEVDEHGRHFDHGSSAITVPSGSMPEDPEIWAQFTHCSGGTPQIGFMGESFTPDQAREKAQQLRRFADDLDDLADQTAAAVRADVASVVAAIRERQADTTGPLAEAIGAMANLVEKTGDPDAVAQLVLGLTTRTLADRR